MRHPFPAACVLLALISFSFLVNELLNKMISASTEPIFTKFSPYGRYLIVDYRFGLLFPMAQGTLPLQPNVGSKLAESDYSPLFVVLAFRNGSQYRQFAILIFKSLSAMTWLYCCKFGEFWSSTPEFKRVVGVHPSYKIINPLRQIISVST